MKTRFLSVIMPLLLVLTLPLSVSAHPVPDPARDGSCSITISMQYKDKPVSGGTIDLYRVGTVVEHDGDYRFVPVDAIIGTIPEFTNIQSPSLAEDLALLKGKLTPVTKTPVRVDKKGTAVFSDLPFGLYLVVQKTAASGYEKTSPFLVSVPYLYQDAYHYDISTAPKTDLQREVKPKPRSSSDSGNQLAQTGQLWWPVPVLICGGLLCIAVGLIRRREADE